jgi:transaldolase
MSVSSALERLAALNPDTEIWWDSSPLIYDDWRAAQRAAWEAQPALLDALAQLGEIGRGLIRGSTTNPPLAWQAIQSDVAYWSSWTFDQAQRARNVSELLWSLYGEVCRRGAELLGDLYEHSRGRYGHICGQVDPRDLTEMDAMLEQAHYLHGLRNNIMIKMPATQEGIEGIRLLSTDGISTTATLCFSVSQMVAVAEAARAGFEHARALGLNLDTCRSTAALMMGRMEDAPPFRQQAEELGLALSETELRWAGVAVAREAYRIFHERGYETDVLCASMRLGPTLDGRTHIWHLEQLLGGDMVLTIFPNIMTSFMELYAEREMAPTIEEPVPDQVLEKLLRIPYFVQAYEEDALAPEQFADLPGVQLTGGGFSDAMGQIDAFADAIWAETRAQSGDIPR